jgi:type IV pilus assembly protein PilB
VESRPTVHFVEAPHDPGTTSKSSSDRSEQPGELYKLLVKEGYLQEDQLRHAKRVHSKMGGTLTLVQVLLELKLIDREQIRTVLTKHQLNLKIGTLLVELGMITKAQLDTAISQQKQSSQKKTLGQFLVEGGFIEEGKLVEVLSYQFGVPYRQLEISKLDRKILKKAPVQWYSQHNFLPVSQVNGKVTVAFVDPMNRSSVEAAEKVFGNITPEICCKSDFQEVLTILERDQTSIRSIQVDERSIIGMVNTIVQDAIKAKASDIHIEPAKDRLRIRFRLDGVLMPYKDLPVEIGPPITSRLKILAKADIAEKRRHQGGRILFEDTVTGGSLDMRVSFFVSIWGENVVLRLLNRKTQLLDLNAIGMYPKTLERFRYDALDTPSGVILVTGPTGSGKTTTLYSSINYLENPNTSIMTVEDPVEYIIDGITQCSIDPKINLTFEESLRHVVRQDPDIIVIGEIRDRFSAETCIQASLTGHKVLSTFHTEDSIGGLVRLLNMNIEAFLISSTVVCVVAQRLLRKVCVHCGERYTLQPAELYRLGYSAANTRGLNFKAGRGCVECRYTGYKGRVGVFELLILNEPVKDAILNKKTSYEIRRISTETSGLITLLEDGIMKAVTGTTSIQEVFRSLPRVSKPRPVAELRRLLGTE